MSNYRTSACSKMSVQCRVIVVSTCTCMCVIFQLHVGLAEFYIGQMQYISDDEPHLGVILGSCASALIVGIVAVAVTAVVCRRSRRCCSYFSQRSRTRSPAAASTAAINAGYLNEVPLPTLKKDRDTLFVTQTGDDGGIVDARDSNGITAVEHLSDMYLTPFGKQRYDNTDGYLAPVAWQMEN